MSRGYCGACGDPFDEVTPCSCGPAAATATKADTDKARHLSDIPDGNYDALRSVFMMAFSQASPGTYEDSTLYLRITAEKNLVHRIAAAIRAALGPEYSSALQRTREGLS